MRGEDEEEKAGGKKRKKGSENRIKWAKILKFQINSYSFKSNLLKS